MFERFFATYCRFLGRGFATFPQFVLTEGLRGGIATNAFTHFCGVVVAVVLDFLIRHNPTEHLAGQKIRERRQSAAHELL